jgi:NMD protein affecting ribosome stability and mRNA decay
MSKKSVKHKAKKTADRELNMTARAKSKDKIRNKDTHGITHKSIHRTAHRTKHVKKVLHKQYSKKFCPNCGKPVMDDATFCKGCKRTDFDFKEIKIILCNNCSSYNHKNKWQKLTNLDDALQRIVSESVKHQVKYNPLEKSKIEELLSYKAGVHKEFDVEVSIGKEHFDLPAIIDVTLCPKCSKQGTKYFEGILQVRNSTDEINDFIKKDIQKQKSKGIHINKETDLDGTGSNIDYYYTNKRYLKIIAEKLRNIFGASIKQNAQLFSIDWSTSKNIYRLNVHVEFPHYHKNDVLKIGKQLFKIVSMDEKIHVINMETKNKTLLPHKDSYDVLKQVEVMLIKRYPEFEVLDPNTYYQARLMNPSNALQINQKIHVVIDGGEAWII